MLRALLATAFALTITLPAAAQQAPAAPAAPAAAPAPEVTTSLAPDTDKHLWCASAFYWLAASAEDSGDSKEAEMYDRWSKRLADVAGAQLTTQGLSPEEVEKITANYDEKVLVDLAGDKPQFDIATCPALLGEYR